jgi:hypothetical protein
MFEFCHKMMRYSHNDNEYQEFDRKNNLFAIWIEFKAFLNDI